MSSVHPVGLVAPIGDLGLKLELPSKIGRGNSDFWRIFDAAFRTVPNIVDMPDAKVRLIVKLLLQNNGRLADRKRDAFYFLRDEEIHSIESAVQEAMEIP